MGHPSRPGRTALAAPVEAEAAGRPLYPAGPPPRPSRRARWLGALAVLAGIAVSLARTGGPGALNSTWIEDGKRFLSGAFAEALPGPLLTPFNGYYHLGPRLLAEVAVLFGVRWSAPVLSLLAAAVLASFAATAFVASRPFLPQWWLRLLVAAPVVAVPLAHTQADNDVATLQFPALYALFWVFLWRPATRGGKVAAVLLAGFVVASSILAVTLLPLLLARLVLIRDWTTRAMALCYAAGATLQFAGLATGATTRDGIGERRLDPLWMAGSYVSRAVPRAVLGERWLGGPGVDASGNPVPLAVPSPAVHVGLIVVAWLVVAAAVAVAALGLTRPHWPLAAAAAVASVAVFAVEIGNMGSVQPRYVIPVALLVYVTLAALLRPRPAGEPLPHRARRLGLVSAHSRYPVLALAVLLAVVTGVNLRGGNTRAESLGWDRIVERATAACAAEPIATYRYTHSWWYVDIPCDRVR
ncbi:hypothetical protein [Rhizomonospora bruguierae]|uniref:hypothetical protein n=1 Tax=Rhizomonospora bruguierae TaxID=1581705 RepID=UPI001BCF140E|nr:hypothetical protein [Micromonospora sp. NBRC 107566]